jgi:phosphate transport system ATP-binding protein
MDVKANSNPTGEKSVVMQLQNLNVSYGAMRAVRDVTLDIFENEITAFIGPSGCGKSTVIRSLNRTNDLIEGAKVEGKVLYRGLDLYAEDVDPIEVRRRIGMVFQKPNPFPKSIFDNVAYGPRVITKNLSKSQTQDIVEQSLQRAGLWDEVKSDLNKNGFALSGGQQQRLCIARAIATNPDVLLMDEPCASLDPIATSIIESLMMDLVKDYTVVIVTHNMQQAARVSDRTAFFTAEIDPTGERYGYLVEIDDTEKMFINPSNKRTEDYIAGRFG